MKVFGVGWAKTGTTTLKSCFRALGYSHYGYNIKLVGQPERAIAIAHLYDTFQDWPWALYYEKLDKAFPGSKFVLTTRNSNRWLRSYRNALSKQSPNQQRAMVETRRQIYGFVSTDATDRQLIDRYEQHNINVMNHFYGRPADFIALDWEQGAGWEELCSFLSKPIPEMPFPHSNKGNYS